MRFGTSARAGAALALTTAVSVSTATGTAGQPIAAGYDSGTFVITPNGQTGYVEGSIARTITPIDLAAGTTSKPINVGSTPDGIVLTS
jgi:DNA-binding beta-propeller fold protein YncE